MCLRQSFFQTDSFPGFSLWESRGFSPPHWPPHTEIFSCWRWRLQCQPGRRISSRGSCNFCKFPDISPSATGPTRIYRCSGHAHAEIYPINRTFKYSPGEHFPGRKNGGAETFHHRFFLSNTGQIRINIHRTTQCLIIAVGTSLITSQVQLKWEL